MVTWGCADGFQKSILGFLLVIVVAAPLFAATDFVESRLTLEWRRWLSRELMKGYYSNRAFFKLHQLPSAELDNPDQVSTANMVCRSSLAWAWTLTAAVQVAFVLPAENLRGRSGICRR